MATGNEPGPPEQYLRSRYVIDELASFGVGRVMDLSPSRIGVLALLGGAFITIGALLSILLASSVDATGPRLLLEGFGFSAGFFFVVLSEAALFTEANVVLPAVLLQEGAVWGRVGRFWILTWVGNLLGAMLVGSLIGLAQTYGADARAVLSEVVERKLEFRAAGGAGEWGKIVLSGMLANWLVGMAAFFATMGRSIIGKYIPVFLAVTAFVAANLQHSPANMGTFALALPMGLGPGWGPALGWSIVPAGLGNILGGALLVALPFWFVWNHRNPG